MVMRKITQNMIIIVCAHGTFTALAMEINQPQEVSSLSQDVVDPNELNIIVEGGASYGSNPVTGKACVVMKRKQLKKVRKGDIVIAPEINSLWYGGLSAAGGIIIEKGDTSSHALALGKKLGIPVIVGATGATKKIIDGQIITCDPIARNVYHVAYPDHKEFQFDVLHIPQKDNKHQMLHDKLIKINNGGWSDDASEKLETSQTKDFFVQQREKINDIATVMHKENMAIKAKSLYNSHSRPFEEWVFAMKSDLYWASWGPDIAFKTIAKKKYKCDDFAIDCVEMVKPLFAKNQKYIENKIHGLYDFMDYVGKILEECHKEFRTESVDFNKIARICHKAHVESMENLPLDVDKNELIDDPIKYKDIEKKIDQKNKKAFLEERDKRVVAGLLVRFIYQEIYGHSPTK